MLHKRLLRWPVFSDRLASYGIILVGIMGWLGCGSPSTELSDESTEYDPGVLVARPLPEDAAPPEHQVYRYLYFEPASLDISMTMYQSHGSEFLFERLCMLNHNNELIPGAAERWEGSSDGRTWTFYLRPGARWSDGHPVTAHDFEYTFKRLLDPDSGNVYAFFYYDIKGAKAYNQRENPDPNAVGVRAVDDLTLVIETEQSCAFLPYIVSFTSSSPVPRWQVEKHGRRWTEAGKCVSNSAFQLERWITGQYMTFGLNKYYEGPNKGYLRKIIRVFTSTVGAASASGGMGLAPYENNEVDDIGINPVYLKRIRNDPVLSKELWTFDTFTTVYLFFRSLTAPFDRLKVRQAIAHAIDNETIANVILKGMRIPAYTMLPLHFPGYVGEKYRHVQRYDPDLARSLLVEAGYSGGRGFPTVELWLIDAAPGSPTGQAAQAIQQMLLNNLGIRISIRNVEVATYRRAQYNWEIPMGIIGFNYDFPDPHSMLGIVWRSQPRGYGRHDWTNTEFDDLIDRAAGEMDHDKRMQMYDSAERILASDVGGVFLWYDMTFSLRKPWVKGIKQNRWGQYPFYKNNTSYCDIYIGNGVLQSGRLLKYP